MPSSTSPDTEEEEEEVDTQEEKGWLQGYYLGEDLEYFLDGTAGLDVDDLMASDMNGVFGLPYQFMDTVDRRLEGSEFGRKYADKIISRIPLLFLTPGKQIFMEDFSKEDTKSVVTQLFEKAAGNDSIDNAESLVSGEGRYYSFGFDYANYFRYVNTMAWSVAYFMGIGNEVVNIGGHRAQLGSFDWSNAQSDAFKSYFSSSTNIVFYLNGLTEISDSFSNSTTESSLASTINGMSDQVREITSLIGSDSVAGVLGDSLTSSNLTSSIESILGTAAGTLGGNVLGSLCSSGVDSLLNGGKIVFPDLWQDSSYTTSYSIDIKLRSPDNDPISLYLNILVPYIHILAFVLPRGVDNYDPNAYSSPFFCRAFCKGMFNVDMGLITSVSATRGGEQNWNNNGIPSQIDLNIEIQDLYPGLFMTSATGDTDKESSSIFHVDEVVNNTAYMDFLSNMAGLNIAQPELLRKAKLRVYLTGSVVKNTPARLGTRLENWVTNKISKLWNIL